ncbi:MAG: Holliday junction branch migration protein RuvA [Coriobacteriia bacterium]
MIAFVRGRVMAKAPGYAIVEASGIGYRLALSNNSLAALPAQGDEVLVWTHLQVREDGLSLFGFATEAEKASFESLITISGIGPKVALAVLSTLSPDALAAAVASEDIGALSSVSGVGKKMAQRIILELKGKLVTAEGTPAAAARGAQAGATAETTDALLGMGFSAAEASVALQGYDGPGADAKAMLRYALKRLGGGL